MHTLEGKIGTHPWPIDGGSSFWRLVFQVGLARLQSFQA